MNIKDGKATEIDGLLTEILKNMREEFLTNEIRKECSNYRTISIFYKYYWEL